MEEQSRFYVVKIIDEYTVVIDGGIEKGLKEGMKFTIYSLSDEDIIHPVTDENLGKLEIIKGTGEIISIQPKLATIKSNKLDKSSNKRRIIRKNNTISMLYAGQRGDEIEEISSSELLPFEDVEIKDFVKRI